MSNNPTFATLLDTQRQTRRMLHADLGTCQERAKEIQARIQRERRETNADETAILDQIVKSAQMTRTQIDAIDAQIAHLEEEQRRDDAAASLARRFTPTGVGRPHYDGVGRVISEPRTYGRGSERSFLSDAWRATQLHDSQAGEFLERSQREAREAMQARAVASSGFAGLIIPQYLVDDAQLALRSGRPVANSATRKPLPEQGMTFQIPRATTGASATVQASENSAVSLTDEVWANLQLTVTTCAGQQVVSRQSLERGIPQLDELIATDLAGAYAANVESQVISGTGAGGQVVGILNTGSINAATAYGAAITAVNFGSKLAGQISTIAAAGSGISARMIAMHPRRWGWLSTLVDTTNRPLIEPNGASPFNPLGINLAPGMDGGDPDPTHGLTVVGTLQGLPVITSPAIPTAVGTNSEDVVLIYDTRQLLLYEDGDGAPTFLKFEQTLGNQLSVTLVSYGYIAFTAGRVPGAVGKVGGLDTVGGNGQIAPTF